MLFDEWDSLHEARLGPTIRGPDGGLGFLPGLGPTHPRFADPKYYDCLLARTRALCGFTDLEVTVVDVIAELRALNGWWIYRRERTRSITSRQVNREIHRLGGIPEGRLHDRRTKAMGRLRPLDGAAVLTREGRRESALQNRLALEAYKKKFGGTRPRLFLHECWRLLRTRVQLSVKEIVDLEWLLGKDRREGRTKEKVRQVVTKAVQSVAPTRRKASARKRAPSSQPSACAACGVAGRVPLTPFRRRLLCPTCLRKP